MADNKIFADAFNIQNVDQDTQQTLPETTTTTTTTGSGGIDQATYLASMKGLELLRVAESPVFKMIAKGTMYDYGKLPGPEQHMDYLHKMSALKKEKLKSKRFLARNMQFLGAFLGDPNFLAIAKENRDSIETDEIKLAKGDLAIKVLSNPEQYTEEDIWEARRNAHADYKDLYGPETLSKNVGAAYYQATADSSMYQGYNYMFPALAQLTGRTGSGSKITVNPNDLDFMNKVLDMESKKELDMDTAKKMASEYDDNPAMKSFIFTHANTDIKSVDKQALAYQVSKDKDSNISMEEIDASIRTLNNFIEQNKDTY